MQCKAPAMSGVLRRRRRRSSRYRATVAMPAVPIICGIVIYEIALPAPEMPKRWHFKEKAYFSKRTHLQVPLQSRWLPAYGERHPPQNRSTQDRGRSIPSRRATPMNVIINDRQARRAGRTGRTRRNLDGPSTPADRTRPTRYAGWHDQPTPKALQRVPRGKSRVIGTPPRVRSIADRTNPVRVLHRATMTHAGHVRLCNSRAHPRYQCRQRAACKPAHSTGEICASRSL